MTKIIYQSTDNEFDIEVKGHAGYAAMGNDIVCAAISVLVQTLLLHMEYVAEDFDAKIDNGYAKIHGVGKDAVASFLTIMTGLAAVAEQHPKYLYMTEGCPMKMDFRLE